MKRLLVAFLIFLMAINAKSQDTTKIDSSVTGSISLGHAVGFPGARWGGFVMFEGDTLKRHASERWVIDSGKMDIFGDTVAAIRDLSRDLYDQRKREDTLKQLFDKILMSVSINNRDTCAERHLAKALRAYNKFAHEGYSIGHGGETRECRKPKTTKLKCCRI